MVRQERQRAPRPPLDAMAVVAHPLPCCFVPSSPHSVAIETRTTAKDSHEVTASRFLFQASASRELRVGASPSSEVHVSDPNVQDHHATIR